MRKNATLRLLRSTFAPILMDFWYPGGFAQGRYGGKGAAALALWECCILASKPMVLLCVYHILPFQGYVHPLKELTYVSSSHSDAEVACARPLYLSLIHI